MRCLTDFLNIADYRDFVRGHYYLVDDPAEIEQEITTLIQALAD
jgi:hypothetical protein